MKTFPTTIIICGITGDLAQKKILPALFDLYTTGRLSDDTRIVGFSRREMSREDVVAFVEKTLTDRGVPHSPQMHAFLEHISYVSGQFDDPASYITLSHHLTELDAEQSGCSNKLFYFSVPPTLYETLATHISQSGLAIPCGGSEGFARILIEKPFGNDLATAEHLDTLLGTLFQEEQIFRIDHYLAKESLFQIIGTHRKEKNLEEKWNNQHIQEVQIHLYEKATVGDRGPSYDGVGAFRDVGQNHMLQMLALTAMDIPQEKSVDAIQNARASVLEHLRVPERGDIFHMNRGQYTGYLHEPGVAEHSLTETFFSMTLFLDMPAFASVPFVLTSGKALEKNQTDIVVFFKDGTHIVFDVPAEDSLPAYEKILLDCISGDQTVFTSTREVLAEWHLVTPIVEIWREIKPFEYSIGADPDTFEKKVV